MRIPLATPLSVGLSALALAAGLALARQGAQQQAQPVLVIEHADAAHWTASPHDAGLVRALRMLPDRIAELPREIDDMPPEAAGIARLVLDLLAQRGTLALTYNPGDPSGGAFGYGLTLEQRLTGEDQAAQINGLTQLVLRDLPQGLPVVPSERFPGLTEIQTPAALVSFGPAEANGETVYRVVAGSVSDPGTARAMLPAPFVGGIDPVFRGSLNLAALTPGVRMAQAMAGPQAQPAGPVIAKLEQAGLLGDNAIRVDFWGGYTADASVSGASVLRARTLWDFLKLPDTPLSAKDFAAIPATAEMAQMLRMDFQFVEALMDHARELGAPVEELLGRLKDETGIDIREDLLRALGGTMAVYTAKSSGTPFIALMQVRDHEALGRFRARLDELASSLPQRARMPGSYVRLDRWTMGGQDLTTLRFPGLPVPFELTCAVVGDWMVLAPTAQGTLFGAAQASGKGDAGLMANAALKAYLPERTDLLSLSFFDASKRLEDGYPIASLVGAALSNAVRSPHGDPRDPGLFMPPLADLAEGARPIVQYSWLEGDDYRVLSTGDRSLLVNISNQIGASIGGIGPQLGNLIGAANRR